MGTAPNYAKANVEKYKQQIESKKKDIARYREILKNGKPTSPDFYKNSIKQWQEDIKVLQTQLARAKEDLARQKKK